MNATPGLRRPFRARSALAGIAALAALLALATLYFLRDPTPRILERRSRLVAWQASRAESIDGHWVQTVHLAAASGLEVDLTVKRPGSDSAALDAGSHSGTAWPASPAAVRRPLVVLLGGHRTGKDAVELIPDTHGTVVVALAYPF